MILLFKSYYVFWNSLSFGRSGMEFRAISCSVTFLLAILNLINPTFQIFDLEELPSFCIFILWIVFYVFGIYVINSNKRRLLEYDKINGKHRISHVYLFAHSINYLAVQLLIMILLETEIIAPNKRCFELSTSIALHKVLAPRSKEQAIGGVTDCFIKLPQSVAWKAKHFDVWHKMKFMITELYKPQTFTDEMICEGIQAY